MKESCLSRSKMSLVTCSIWRPECSSINMASTLTLLSKLLLKTLNKKSMPFRLENFNLDPETLALDHSAFVTFDSFDKLRDFNNKLDLTNDYFKPLQLFVFCQGAKASQLEALASDVNGRSKISLKEVGPNNVLIPTSTRLSDLIQ